MTDLRCLTGIAVVAILMGGTGCDTIKEKIIEKVTEKAVEKATEKAIESRTGGKVDIDQGNGTISFKGKNGETSEWGSTKLPEGWPSEVPLYPGAKITTSMRMGENMSVTIQTPDSMDKVSSFYDAKFSGFEKALAMESDKAKSATYTKGKLEVILTIGHGNDDTTGVNFIVSTKK